MNFRLLAATIGLALCLFTQALSAASVPKLINYQGSLSDSSGNPLATADYTLTFHIYDSPTGGTLVWGPQIFDGSTATGRGALVPVVKGYFNVIMGPVDISNRSLDSAFGPNKANRYLQVTVSGGSPILPRQQILSAPYAMSSGWSPGDVPVGAIVPYYRPLSTLGELAANWKLADGTTVTDPESPLFNTAVPNLNGRFLRGSSSSANWYSGSDTHQHYFSSSNVSFPLKSLNGWSHGYQVPSRATSFYPNIRSMDVDTNEVGWPKSSHAHSNGFVSGTTAAGSNLPSYFSVFYIIRIK